MIDLEFVEGLIRALDESGLDSIDIERGGTRVRVSKTPPPAAPVTAASGPAAVEVSATSAPLDEGEPVPAPDGAVADGLLNVSSPMVGTFYRSPSPDSPAFVSPGDMVAVGDTLCIIEAMKLMNELEAEVAGRVEEVSVENGQPVEFGQLLFRIVPA
jgi:acetyl-CoA carboxylase biotin carboxyl carrier protein